jgi:hypothetical protein
VTVRRAELAVLCVLTAAAVLLFLLAPTYPNYDAYYHLDWGREIVRGHSPSFEAYQAPTQHPLYVAIAAALTLLGDDADRLLVLVSVLSLVALVWGVYRLGEAVFGRWPGIAAAAFAGSSFAFLLYAVRAYVDVPFLALVMWAAVVEARRPRAGAAVMAMLAVAGLLRPEAWVLAGAYWLWVGRLGPARVWRLDLLVLAAAAPLLWALIDLAVTGDPLFSLHSTSDLADELHRDSGLGAVPGGFVRFLSATARPPVAAAGALGIVLALQRRPPAPVRSLHVPLALFGAGAVTFVLSAGAGLSVLPRYLTVPAVALALFAGYAVLGFTTLPAGSRMRRRWSRAAIAAAVIGAAFVVFKLPSVGKLAGELRFIRSTHDDLVAVLRAPRVRSGLECGPLTFPNYRLVPDARWILDLPRDRVGSRSARPRDRGVAVFVLGEKALRRFGFAAGASPKTNVPDPGFVPIARHGHFAAYAACSKQHH